jgi:hypothetical protein
MRLALHSCDARRFLRSPRGIGRRPRTCPGRHANCLTVRRPTSLAPAGRPSTRHGRLAGPVAPLLYLIASAWDLVAVSRHADQSSRLELRSSTYLDAMRKGAQCAPGESMVVVRARERQACATASTARQTAPAPPLRYDLSEAEPMPASIRHYKVRLRRSSRLPYRIARRLPGLLLVALAFGLLLFAYSARR